MKTNRLIILIPVLILFACSKFTGSKEPLYTSDSVSPDSTRTVLVAYFSRSGNTEKVAKAIAHHTGGTLYRIERKHPYPEDFKECEKKKKKELNDSIFPVLRDTITDIDRYDVIFVGGPVWWHTAPMPLVSFLRKCDYDFTGKIIVPFCSYANMFPNETLLEIVNATPNAVHPHGFISHEGDTLGLSKWLHYIKLIEPAI